MIFRISIGRFFRFKMSIFGFFFYIFAPASALDGWRSRSFCFLLGPKKPIFQGQTLLLVSGFVDFRRKKSCEFRQLGWNKKSSLEMCVEPMVSHEQNQLTVLSIECWLFNDGILISWLIIPIISCVVFHPQQIP